MKLELKRRILTPEYTIGDLLVDGEFFAFTCEDAVRLGPKVYGKTAIPAGEYSIALTMSPRFKRILPLLCCVPGFEGVRIHAGNTAADTEGCILVGLQRGHGGTILHSRTALERLLAKMMRAKGRISIDIRTALDTATPTGAG